MVIEAGNLLRGSGYEARGIDRSSADQMGVLGTVIKALAFQDALERAGVTTRVLSAIAMQAGASRTSPARGAPPRRGMGGNLRRRHGRPLLHYGHRGEHARLEIGAEVILKVEPSRDGVATAIRWRTRAKRFDRLAYSEVLKRDLR